jgi:hypothetical protein
MYLTYIVNSKTRMEEGENEEEEKKGGTPLGNITN